MTKIRIKVGEISSFPFVGRDFVVPLQLVDDAEKVVTLREALRVEASAIFEGLPSIQCPHSLFSSTKGKIDVTGIGSISLKFNDVSMNFENRKIIVNITPAGAATHPRDIGFASTPALYVIKYKLIIEEENTQPYIWYKDEGGKEKCIELRVHMVDYDNNIIRNRKVPLRVSLQYKNAGQVPQQNILSVSSDTRQVIDEHYGECLIKFRVNEVSTRHQGQMFQLLVGPDLAQAPSAADISSALCVAVDVKSKRNNHRDRAANKAGGGMNPLLGPLGSYNGLLDGINNGDVMDGMPMKRARSDGAGTIPDARAAAQDFTHLFSQKKLLNGTKFKDDASFPAVGTAAFQNPESFSGALENIILWARTVMDGMEQIQWKQIGYKQHPDGSLDYSKPMHSIPNPQAAINEIVVQYTNFVKSSLHYLATAADNQYCRAAGNNNSSELWSGANGAGIPGNDGGVILNGTRKAGKDDVEMRGGADALDDMEGVLQGWSNPPRLAREFSFGSSNPFPELELPQLTRNHSLFLDQNQSTFEGNNKSKEIFEFPCALPLARSVSAEYNSAGGLDSQVYYILARTVNTPSAGDVGLPAFDKSKNLVGFYTETFNGIDNISYPIFKLAASVSNLNSEDMLSITTTFIEAINTQDDAIFSLGRSPNFEKLKEDALIYNLMKETMDQDLFA